MRISAPVVIAAQDNLLPADRLGRVQSVIGYFLPFTRELVAESSRMGRVGPGQTICVLTLPHTSVHGR